MHNKQQFIRFCLVGVANTLTDSLLFLVLRQSAHLPLVIANTCSTSAGLLVSLSLNYRFTFRGRQLTRYRLMLYIGVTLAGLWLLQPIVIAILDWLNHALHYTAPIISLLGHAASINTLAPKLGSVVVTLLWNYAWYSHVVFKTTKTPPATIPEE